MSAPFCPATARRIFIDLLLCIPGQSLVADLKATVSNSHARVLNVDDVNTPVRCDAGDDGTNLRARDLQFRVIDAFAPDDLAPARLLKETRLRSAEARRFRWTT